MDSKKWLEFFHDNQSANNANDPLEKVYNEMDRLRITHEGAWRNMNGSTDQTFDQKLDTFFTRVYAENLEPFRRVETDDSDNLVNGERKQQPQIGNGITFPNIKTLKTFEKYTDKRFEQYDYPVCWDYCQMCSENGLVYCENCDKCKNYKEIFYNKYLDEQKQLKEQAEIKDYENNQMYNNRFYTSNNGTLKGDDQVPDMLIARCFETDSVKYFETRKQYPPAWKETFEKHNQMTNEA